MVVLAMVFEGIKAVAVEAVAVVNAGVLGDVEAVEAADTKEGYVMAVGRAISLATSMVLIYQTTTIVPTNLNKW